MKQKRAQPSKPDPQEFVSYFFSPFAGAKRIENAAGFGCFQEPLAARQQAFNAPGGAAAISLPLPQDRFQAATAKLAQAPESLSSVLKLRRPYC